MIRFKNILCPVDFFPGSLRAFDYALKLAVHYDARLHMLHVVSPVLAGDYGHAANLNDITAMIEVESARQLDKLSARASKKGVKVSSEVRTGSIDGEIRRAIRSRNADLVVMGTHGRRGLERLMLGSVAERLVRQCPVPLLTIKGSKGGKAVTAPPTIKRIVVTTDFSSGTADALNYAFSMAQECQARIKLLHVIETPVERGWKIREPLLSSIRQNLADLVPPGVTDWCEVKTQIESGVPYRVILKLLKSERVDLLVMNIHGKSRLERALMGSTAERVLRAAACPVMLIPPMQAGAEKAAKAGKKAA